MLLEKLFAVRKIESLIAKGGLMKDVKFFVGQPTKYLILY